MRTLICVPVIHNYADQGLPWEKAFNFELPARKFWEKVEYLWDVIGAEISKLGLDYSKVQIYQDSFSEEASYGLVSYMALSGSRNYQYIFQYISAGAVLMQTENHYLLEKYLRPESFNRKESESDLFYLVRIFPQVLLLFFFPDYYFFKVRKDSIERRDAYIAGRIQNTLCEGNVGILFMGAAHNVRGFITAGDIRIVNLPVVDAEVQKIRKEFRI